MDNLTHTNGGWERLIKNMDSIQALNLILTNTTLFGSTLLNILVNVIAFGLGILIFNFGLRKAIKAQKEWDDNIRDIRGY